MKFELMTVKGHQLVIPTTKVVDAFIKCHMKPSISLIIELCEACSISVSTHKINNLYNELYQPLYESCFMHKDNDAVLNALFDRIASPQIATEHAVYEAVVALNYLYSTRLDNSYATAANIHTRINEIKNTNPPEVIDTLTCINHSKDAKEDHIYSFASKFWSFLKPDTYPIFDRYSSNLICLYLQHKNVSPEHVEHKIKKNLGNPTYYKGAFDEFQELYDLEKRTYKEVDIFLWMYGKMLEASGSMSFYGISYIAN